MKRSSLRLFLSLALLPILVFACSSDSDDEEITAELEDLFTDALNFEGGTVKDGTPPEGQSGADAPQLSAVQGDTLRLGAPFAFSLASDFAEAENVTKAVVFVKGSAKYIEVDAGLAAGTAELFGRLQAETDLRGKAFTLEFALQTADGHTGEYRSLEVSVADEDAQELTMGEEIILLTSVGETSHESGRPEGRAGADVPQILSLSGPATLAAGETFMLSLETAYTGKVSAVLLTTPGNAAYKELPATLSEGHVMVGGELADASEGERLTFLFALTNESGAGLYRSWSFTVGSGVADGDADGDADNAVDGDTDNAVDGDTDNAVDGDEESTGATWTDTTTGFVWEKPHSNIITWQAAIDYCDTLNLDGYDDWRLPDITELRTLLRGCPATETGGTCNVGVGAEECLDRSCKDDTCVGCANDGGPDPNGCYWPDEMNGGCVIVWSASVATGSLSDSAWHVNFNYGGVDRDNQGYPNNSICVRN